MPPTHDLSFTGLVEFVNKPKVENCKAKSSEEEPKHGGLPWIRGVFGSLDPRILTTPSSSLMTLEIVLSLGSKCGALRKKYGALGELMWVSFNGFTGSMVNLQNQRVIDSGFSRHMTRNMSYLKDYEEIDGGYVAFGGNPKGGKITRKYTIKTDHLGKCDGKADECFFVRYSFSSKAFRVFNSRTRIVEENLHIRFSESTQSNVLQVQKQVIMQISHDDGSKPSSDDGKNVDKDPSKESKCNDQEKKDNVTALTIELSFDPNISTMEDVGIFDFSSDHEDNGAMADMNNLDTTIQAIFTYASFKDFVVYQMDVKSAFLYGKIEKEVRTYILLRITSKAKKDGIFISQDKYVAKILKKFRFTKVKTASTPMETQNPLLKDKDGEKVDIHMYRSMIGSLMYLTSSRPDIMFAVYACARYQVNPKVLHLHAVKRIFSDYARASLDRRSMTGDEEGIDFLPNSTIFEELALMGLVRAATTASSLEAEQDSGGGPRCQETIGDTTAQTRFESISKHSNDSLLARGKILQSDKDRLKLDELMALCTNLQTRVLELEKTKTTQYNKIASLKRRVKKLKKRNRSRTHKLKRLYKVSLTARVESSDDKESLSEDASKQGRIKTINVDDDNTLVNVQDDAEMFDVNALDGKKVKGITIQELGESTTTIPKQQSQGKGKEKMIEEPVKPKKKDQIRLDEEAALKLQAEFHEEERLAREKAKKNKKPILP
uniref:Retroviral polymerase SH3-like domain-containing protein n=1 Tax=Tanacetum cinerariifolium TaxID=118510 RepID=A0A6L2KBV6_TANCI|nr:hypothetical protein [Tanacetum cinerariifolium]